MMMTLAIEQMERTERTSALQERINLLYNQGYRGFTVIGRRMNWENVLVKAENKKGRIIKAEGSTVDEAYENLIEMIDYSMDGPP